MDQDSHSAQTGRGKPKERPVMARLRTQREPVMDRTHIELWLEREFDADSLRPDHDTVLFMSEVAERLMPLLARIYEEGYEDGAVDQASGSIAVDPRTPYGEPTDYAGAS